MKGILTGFVICCALALASPVAAEAQGEGKEKAAEQAQEAVNKETPAAQDKQPPVSADKAAKKSDAAKTAADDAAEPMEPSASAAQRRTAASWSSSARVSASVAGAWRSFPPYRIPIGRPPSPVTTASVNPRIRSSWALTWSTMRR